MAEPSVEDMKAMYQHSLVMIKNTPVYVETIYGSTKIGGFNINTQRKEIYELGSHLDMKAPGRCLGFINYEGKCVYMCRTPIRRYKVGVNRENCMLTLPDGWRGAYIKDAIVRLTAPEIADTIKGRYPSIMDAWERVKDRAEEIVAFDRQFAIDFRGNVYFKANKVGKAEKPKDVYDIKFNKGSEYLILLLDNNHEKTVPTA